MHDQPEDDHIRLVFADWLEERNDPRAELIHRTHEWLMADRELTNNPDSTALLET